MKTTILTSSFCAPSAIAALTDNLNSFSHRDVEICVLGRPGDSPEGYSSNAVFLSARDQVGVLAAHHPELARSFGHDAYLPAMAGLFHAWLEGASYVLLWGCSPPAPDHDLLGGHYAAMQGRRLPHVSSSRGWYNLYALLQKEGPPGPGVHSGGPFPRGFPLEQRRGGPVADEFFEERKASVAANVGLPLGPLDEDGLSRLACGEAWSVSGARQPASVALSPDCWCPFPAVNLMLRREVIPAYYLCPQLHRYGAVWGSLVLQRVTGHLGDVIAAGAPLAAPAAPFSDPWLDLDRERPGLRRTAELARALRSIPLRGLSYAECAQQIAAELPLQWSQGSLRGPGAWSGYEVDWRKRFLEGLRSWVEACATAASRSTANLGAALDASRRITPVLTRS